MGKEDGRGDVTFVCFRKGPQAIHVKREEQNGWRVQPIVPPRVPLTPRPPAVS